MKNKVIIPIRLDSYAGDESALEAHFFEDKEEYGGKSVPDDSMWAAVYILDGKIDHSMTEYGYRSLEELLDTHKKEKIMGIKENRKDAELERARDIAEDALELLLTEDSVLLHVEGELNLAPGSIKKAYRTLQKARTGRAKKTGIDKDEVFYSLSIEDILIQAKEMRIPRKKLTPEVIKRIEIKIEDSMGTGNEMIQDAISEVLSEKKDTDKLKEDEWIALEDKSASDVDEIKKRLGIGGAD